MDLCFLCLESVNCLDNCILVDSEQWNEQNMKDLVYKHLWPMEISTSGWICMSCGDVLCDFRKFYNLIKCAQQNYGSIFKRENELTQIAVLDIECAKDKRKDEINAYVRDTLKESNLEQHIGVEQTLPTEFIIDGPYVKCQILDNLSGDDKTVNKNRKRGRPAKNISLNTDENSKDPLTKIMKINKESKSKKKLLISVGVSIENENGFESEIISCPSSLHAKENNDSETDSEHRDTDQSPRDIKKKNHRNLDEKTLKEYDKIIGENFKIFCNLCQIEMDNFLSLRRHFKIEHKQRGYARCCKRNFFTRSLLVDHIHVHLNPEYFKCHQCSKIFSDRSRLLCHRKLHDDDSKLDKCNICGKLFADKGALKKHVLTHSSQKLFPCTICGKFFTNSFILNHHIEAVHQNKFVQICDICGKSIRCPTAFASHMEKHEVKTVSISCDVCGLLLTNKEGLKRHKNSQHPAGGKKQHTCHICSKVSPTQRALKSHIRSVHEQGFDFKCTLCEKSFKRPAVLREHMATHTGTALYKCLWCPRTFISNGNMYNHRKNAHPNEWEELKRQRYAGNMS